jgi:O-methyltransferase/8-demethyl-8-(2,3-dimethoxy-alpha-L-rhamnosyl)tetracenomycin-C 4'-O-methyltransferase
VSGFLISIIRPNGYLHSDAFKEVAETLLYGLKHLGHQAAILENTVDPQVVNIVLGAHLLSEKDCQSLPAGTIIYNLEQLGSSHLTDAYYKLAERYQIWDYSPINIAHWKDRACAFAPALVEIGYSPELRRIQSSPEQHIDVLFYGSLNEPRLAILRQLEDAGARVRAAFGVYGKERDALIARSKIVLNMHGYDAKLFEVVRVSYLLANSKAVVSETAQDIGEFESAVAAFPYEGLVQGCLDLLKDNARRVQLEEDGFRVFSRRPITQILEKALSAPKTTSSIEELRTLYLDMIQKCIINVIYEDPNQDLWSPHEYNDKLREYGRDWPSKAHSMIGNTRMTNLRKIVEQVICKGIAGDLIETGVWRGGACIMMRAVLKAYGVTDRQIWVADSFCGLPKPKENIRADAGDIHHTFKELAISIDEVKANFTKYGLLDHQVRFLKGWFSETLPSAPIEALAVLRLDGDMYESTMDALVNLYDKVSEGGFIIIDDFGAVPGCQKAVRDFRASLQIQEPIHNIDGYGVFWQKVS